LFTGLIADLGTVLAVDADEAGARLRVRTALAPELSPGDSVALNGVCLTASACEEDSFGAEVMRETLRRTSLGELAPGARVNLELPLRPTGRLGGHIVQGHIDATGTIIGVEEDGFARRLTIAAPAQVLRYVVERGSIAVDGVSLTVAAVDARSFGVSLIPETIARTNLGRLRAGAKVNLEVDMLAKYVEKLMPGCATRPKG
jgi:riboflavin synthase